MSVHVVIAVRGGAEAKSRCAGRIDGAALAEAMLRDMVEAAAACPDVTGVHVVTPTPEVAAGLPVSVIVEAQAAGMNAAFEHARQTLPDDATIVMLPGDLPQLRAADLSALIAAHQPGGVTVVPSATDAGTGAIVIEAAHAMRFAFGAGSFSRHMAEPGARRFECAAIGEDLDRPEDAHRALTMGGRHSRACLAHYMTEET